MTKAQKTEREAARVQLRESIKPGDTVYTILDHVSRSGMNRHIRVVLLGCDNGKPTDLHPNWAVGKALGISHAKRNGRELDALSIGGCGMDMGFHLVYELSYALYGAGYQCLGEGKCPSNYHMNYRTRERCPGADGRFCWKPDAYSTRYPVPEGWPYREETTTVAGADGQPLSHTYKVLLACLSTGDDSIGPVCPTCNGVGDLANPDWPQRFDLVHTDGYALRHRWL